jgi:hypothetical protein
MQGVKEACRDARSKRSMFPSRINPHTTEKHRRRCKLFLSSSFRGAIVFIEILNPLGIILVSAYKTLFRIFNTFLD